MGRKKKKIWPKHYSIFIKICIVCGEKFITDDDKRKICYAYLCRWNLINQSWEYEDKSSDLPIELPSSLIEESKKPMGRWEYPEGLESKKKPNRKYDRPIFVEDKRSRMKPNYIKDRKRNPSKKQKEFVWERDGKICQYCGDYGDVLDHVLPFSHGGRTIVSNLVCSCSRCNLLVKDRVFGSFDEKRRWIMSRLGL